MTNQIADMLAELRQGLPPAPDANLELAATRTPEAPRCARCGLLPEENAPYLAEVAEFEDVDLAKMSPGEVRDLARKLAFMRFGHRVTHC